MQNGGTVNMATKKGKRLSVPVTDPTYGRLEKLATHLGTGVSVTNVATMAVSEALPLLESRHFGAPLPDAFRLTVGPVVAPAESAAAESAAVPRVDGFTTKRTQVNIATLAGRAKALGFKIVDVTKNTATRREGMASTTDVAAGAQAIERMISPVPMGPIAPSGLAAQQAMRASAPIVQGSAVATTQAELDRLQEAQAQARRKRQIDAAPVQQLAPSGANGAQPQPPAKSALHPSGECVIYSIGGDDFEIHRMHNETEARFQGRVDVELKWAQEQSGEFKFAIEHTPDRMRTPADTDTGMPDLMGDGSVSPGADAAYPDPSPPTPVVAAMADAAIDVTVPAVGESDEQVKQALVAAVDTSHETQTQERIKVKLAELIANGMGIEDAYAAARASVLPEGSEKVAEVADVTPLFPANVSPDQLDPMACIHGIRFDRNPMCEECVSQGF